jgi:hypothetical protein
MQEGLKQIIIGKNILQIMVMLIDLGKFMEK